MEQSTVEERRLGKPVNKTIRIRNSRQTGLQLTSGIVKSTNI